MLAHGPARGGSTRKILVVEDDPSVASLVRDFLEGEGYAASISTEAESAWATLQSEPADAAVVDISLAGVWTGWDLVERVRNDPRIERLPIVICTGESSGDIAERIQRLRCAYLAKPFSLAALLDRLQLAIKAAGNAPPISPHTLAILTATYRIEGTVYLPQDLTRFSDAWEALMSDGRAFIPVTRARVLTPDGTSLILSQDLVEVRKDHVEVAFSTADTQPPAETPTPFA